MIVSDFDLEQIRRRHGAASSTRLLNPTANGLERYPDNWRYEEIQFVKYALDDMNDLLCEVLPHRGVLRGAKVQGGTG